MDEDLQAEYEAVLRTGLFDVIIFGYDDWFSKIKDYVKSVKGADFPKYFDSTVAQDELNRWMEI